MIRKSIDVNLAAWTWPRKLIPAVFNTPGPNTVDLSAALLLLGNVTVPSGLASTSFARYWGYVRYLSAFAPTHDLRVAAPYVTLDPHQRTIMSDDLGVAISMHWITERLGGVQSIVDGRQFVAQYSSVLRKKITRAPKNGPDKCPDFVVLDRSGKWHVVECKGTQTSANYRDKQLGIAGKHSGKGIAQKTAIDVVSSLRGERLAAGLFLATEGDSKSSSSLHVVDPESEDEPYMTLQEDEADDAARILKRLEVSRMLSLSGMELLGEEMSLPEEAEFAGQILTERERGYMGRSRTERMERAFGQVRTYKPTEFTWNNSNFQGRVMEFPISDQYFYEATKCQRVRIRQGIASNYFDRIRAQSEKTLSALDEIAAEFTTDEGLVMDSSDHTTTLRYGGIYFAEMSFE